MMIMLSLLAILWFLGVLFVLSLTKAAQRADVMLEDYFHSQTNVREIPRHRNSI